MKTFTARALVGLSVLVYLGLSGCGQKGPLYLPQSEQPATEAEKPTQPDAQKSKTTD